MNKKYRSKHYRINFYGDTLEELAQNIKNEYSEIRTMYPAMLDSTCGVYIAMNYYGYDINTLEMKTRRKTVRKTMDIQIDDLKLLLIHTIEYVPLVMDSSCDKLRSAISNIYKNMPDIEKKEIEEKYSKELNAWNLK